MALEDRHTHAQAQVIAHAGLLQGQACRLPVGRVKPRKPLLQAGVVGQIKTRGQGRVQVQAVLAGPGPPTCAQLLLQLRQVTALLLQPGMPITAEHRFDQGLPQQVRIGGHLLPAGTQQPGLTCEPSRYGSTNSETPPHSVSSSAGSVAAV